MLAGCLLLCWLAVAFRNAWLCDDAFISFRTLDNCIHGYGLRWNVDERVQTYTHPLWLFVMAPFVALTGEYYYTVIILSLVISLAGVVLVAWPLAHGARAAAVGVLALVLSKAYMDFSTSGLENSLSHVLVLVFAWVYLGKGRGPWWLFGLSLLASLGALNRLDAVLVYAPALAFAWWRARSWRALGYVAAGFIPLVAWEAFSLFYYGSLFPNTGYAKLFSTDLGQVTLARRGVYYLLHSLRIDPVTLGVTALGLFAGVVSRDKRQWALVAGVLLQLLYTVRVGGCFMSGRLLTVAFVVALVLFVRAEWPFLTGRRAVLTGGLVLVLGALAPFPPPLTGSDYGHQDAWVQRPLLFRDTVMDERGNYYPHTGLLRHLRGWSRGDVDWLEAQDRGPWLEEQGWIVVAGRVGLLGLRAGPGVHIVDRMALCDPLLARLPALELDPWMSGHYLRLVPEGYLRTLAEGENHITDPAVAAYYDLLREATRGPLWSWVRLKAVAALNLGHGGDAIDRAAYRAGTALEDKEQALRVTRDGLPVR